MYPTKAQALVLLNEAEQRNPGDWGRHSMLVAECAEKIAKEAGLNPDKAYVLGLLHDIGRRFGITGFAHVVDGYDYLMDLGFDEAARICLTHSFSTHNLDDYIGRFDVDDARLTAARDLLTSLEFDDYDRLIQLCDCLAGSEIVDIEVRMNQVKARYGHYPQVKWDQNLALKKYFERKTDKTIEEIIGLSPRCTIV